MLGILLQKVNKSDNLVTILVGCLCHGKLNHKIAGQASAAIYYHIQFQQMAGCISMYTSMQTSCFQMSLQHCLHWMPSMDVTAQTHFFAKETECHVSWWWKRTKHHSQSMRSAFHTLCRWIVPLQIRCHQWRGCWLLLPRMNQCKLMRSGQPSSDSVLEVGVRNHITDDILSAVEP